MRSKERASCAQPPAKQKLFLAQGENAAFFQLGILGGGLCFQNQVLCWRVKEWGLLVAQAQAASRLGHGREPCLATLEERGLAFQVEGHLDNLCSVSTCETRQRLPAKMMRWRVPRRQVLRKPELR